MEENWEQLTKEGENTFTTPAKVRDEGNGIRIHVEYETGPRPETKKIWLSNKEALRLALFIFRQYFEDKV